MLRGKIEGLHLVSFNLLLSHQWIHSVGAIPYSLHLKVKFIHDGRVITISSTGGENLISEPVLEISMGVMICL